MTDFSNKILLAVAASVALSIATPGPVAAQDQPQGGLADMAQGLDDFAPDVAEQSLGDLEGKGALIPDATSPDAAAPAAPPLAVAAAPQTQPQAAPSAAPAPTAANPGPAIPANWVRHEIAGLSIAVPSDWADINERDDALQIGDLDKAAKKGVMLMMGIQRRDPRDDKLPPEMTETPLADVALGGHEFSQSVYQGKVGGQRMYVHMFFSKDADFEDRRSRATYALLALSVTNLDPADYQDTFATILASIKPAAPEKPAGPQTAKIGFVSFTLPKGWKVLRDKEHALSIQVANSYAAYLMVETGIYSKDAVSRVTGPGQRTTILGQPAKMYTGETDITVIRNGVGAIVKAVSRTYVLGACTADGDPIVIEETGAPEWLKSDGFGALEAAIHFSLPDGAIACDTPPAAVPARPAPAPRSAPLATAPSPPAPPPAPTVRPKTDPAFWQSIAGSRAPADFLAYLDQFPYGTYADLARSRLSALERTRQHRSRASRQPAVVAKTAPFTPAGSAYYTPHRNTAERAQIMAAARLPVAGALGQRDVVFLVEILRSDHSWAYLQAVPQQSNGAPIDWLKTPFAHDWTADAMSDVVMVLLHRDAGHWRAVDFVIGPTDVYWYDWVSKYHLPEALFKG